MENDRNQDPGDGFQDGMSVRSVDHLVGMIYFIFGNG